MGRRSKVASSTTSITEAPLNLLRDDGRRVMHSWRTAWRVNGLRPRIWIRSAEENGRHQLCEDAIIKVNQRNCVQNPQVNDVAKASPQLESLATPAAAPS